MDHKTSSNSYKYTYDFSSIANIYWCRYKPTNVVTNRSESSKQSEWCYLMIAFRHQAEKYEKEVDNKWVNDTSFVGNIHRQPQHHMFIQSSFKRIYPKR